MHHDIRRLRLPHDLPQTILPRRGVPQLHHCAREPCCSPRPGLSIVSAFRAHSGQGEPSPFSHRSRAQSVFVVLEAILVFGAFEYADSSTNMRFIKLDIFLLVNALFAAGAGMITFGALIGKVSPLQILIILFLQVPLWAANVVFVFSRGFLLQGADDAGGAIAIHTFGAYYGIAATFVAFRNKPNLGAGHERNSANYTSNVTSLIGTIFLWILWPSFNGIFTGDARMVSFANTVISISGATLATFAIAPFLSESGRINVVMVQNATLAGGVAIGAVPDLKIGAGVVLLVGFGAGILSCVGFAKLGPFMERKLGVRDTCGVHSLHGMPGVYGGIVGVCALLALGSPAAATAEFGFLAVTIVIAVAGGGAAGFVSTLVDKVTSDDRHSVLAYEDHTVFEFDDV
mmetsp:Transcript_7531/g.22026  ORF Transcript_7531/g.22026 Transcript_7531/m.22026 type:complete len:402 (+) Transcript_7531:337-1542(+)